MSPVNLTVIIMTHRILLFTFLLTIPSSVTLGQGRVDSDKILYNIYWTTRRIDQDTTLKYFVIKDTVDVRTNFVAYYSQIDTLRKVSSLTKVANGTEMVTVYYGNKKPILIVHAINTFPLSKNIADFSVALSSFADVVDTLMSPKPRYKVKSETKYYFYKGNVRFSAKLTYSDDGTVEDIRHDNKSDITMGMKLYNRGLKYVKLYSRGYPSAGLIAFIIQN